MFAKLIPILAICLGCGSALPPPPSAAFPDPARPLAKPKRRKSRLVVEIIDKSFDYQISQVLDLPRMGRRLIGRPYEALNVDEFDEVSNSAWFTNRNGVEPLSPQAISRGPNRSNGPDMSAPWKVVAIKSAGVTPGMTILDGRDDRYIIKFDPPDFPQLASAAEVVAARLLHAAGYNVPENYITYVEKRRLTLESEARLTVTTNDSRPPISSRSVRRVDLEGLLERAGSDGGPIRVLASRFLEGIPIGPWSYTGVRRDDPNDIYAHEHRREIRGFYVIASWLNHADMKEENTLDMYDPKTKQVTHYLIDFGASMGSNSTHASNPRRGQANSLDVRDSLTRLFSLGLYVHNYEKAPRTVFHPSVGYLDNRLFKADRWKPMYPVPAFENMTNRDAFWGAAIVTSFSKAQIEAAVAAAELSEPKAAQGLVNFLAERRDRVGAYWFSRLNALTRFQIENGDRLSGSDLAVTRGYAATQETRYRIRVWSDGRQLLQLENLEPTLTLETSWQKLGSVAVSFLPLRVNRESPKPVWVYLNSTAGRWKLAGLRRLD